MNKADKNVLDAFLYLSRLKIGYKVKSENSDIEQTLCGFIPVFGKEPNTLGSNIFFDTDNFSVGYQNIKINVTQITQYKNIEGPIFLPVAKYIKRAKSDDKIPVTSFIKLFDVDQKSLKAYQSKILTIIASPSDIIKPVERFENTEKMKLYLPCDNQIIFEREDETVAVAKDFLCLCSYINPVTGKITYAVQVPDTIYPVVSEEDLC